MSQPEHFDALVIGSGEGGKYLAWHLAKSGRRTAVVERKLIGGSCPNTNCLPSKNEIWSAKVADLVRRAEQFGMMTSPSNLDMTKVLAVRRAEQFGMMTSPSNLDMTKVLARKRAMIDGLIALHLELYTASGAELIMGAARFTAPKSVEVSLNDGGTRTLSGDRVFLNIGTHATIPGIPGLSDASPLTNVEALELDRLPSHLIVLGGGYVGLELAQAYRRFGAAVTVIESGPQLAAREDPDVAAAILDMLREEGIAVHLATTVVAVQGKSGGKVAVQITAPGGDLTLDGSHILVAVGRTPNTAGIGLDVAGVDLDYLQYISVNERLETSAPDVWALGECAGSPQFTHVSFDDFRIIRDNLAGGNRTSRGRLVPYCMYTDPPLARVGLSEREAESRGIAVRAATLPIVFVLRSRTISETRGFMKALVAADSDRLLGFAMIGAEAGEVLAAVQAAMLAGMPYTGLRDAIIAHPTMAEGLGPLLSKIPVTPVHKS